MRIRTPHTDEGRVLAAYALAVVVLLVDVVTVRELACGMLYLPLVPLAGLGNRPRHVWGFTALTVAFTAAGAFVGFRGEPLDTAILANRLLVCVALVAAGWVTDRFVRARTRQAAMEATVGDQEQLLRIAGDVGRLGGWSVDGATGESRWSREVAEIVGLPVNGSQPVQLSIDMYVEEDRERVAEAFRRCVTEGRSFDEELRLNRADDGRLVWINTIGRAEQDASGRVVRVIGAVQDITARKEAEQAAEDSARRLNLLADSLPVLVWRTTPAGGIDYFSQGLADYTGVPAEEILGDAWVGVIHPDDQDRAVEAWTATVTSGTPYNIEFRIRRHDGAYRWHLTTATAERDDAGAVLAYWGSCVDVHDRQEFRRRSQDLAARLTWTLESISDAVVGLDEDGVITVLNQRAVELLGLSRGDLLGSSALDIPGALDSVFHEQIGLAAVTGEPVRFEAPYDEIGRQLEVSAFPHDRGVTVYFRDVTDARATEDRLRHVQRLESLGQLTGGVAHDFNNLLTVVIGSAEVLAKRLSDDPALAHLAASIAAAGQRGAELTHSLLAFARKQPLNPTRVDLNALVEDTRLLLGRTLGHGIRVETVLTERPEPCQVDRVQLENALLNLCINGRDAMPDGGTLRLSTGRVTLDPAEAAVLADASPGEYVSVSVTDTGTGIPADVQDRVFEPFFTTKPPGKGSGLGLAMVYGFVAQSRGHVQLESVPGEGTTVRLLLPLVHEPASVESSP